MSKHTLDADTIIAMMRSEPKRYQFSPDYRLTCLVKGTAFEDIIDTARKNATRDMTSISGVLRIPESWAM